MYYGDAYHTYITKELPEVSSKFFPIDLPGNILPGFPWEATEL